jgi:hypothetical protein
MMRSLLLAILCVLSSLLAPCCSAFSVGHSAVSGFHGNVVRLVAANDGANSNARSPRLLTMRKGKDNVPPQMRSQYKRQKELAQMRDQMIAATKPGEDGLPVFNLFVRTSKANVRFRSVCVCVCVCVCVEIYVYLY